jgi:hypothetical protein
MWGNDVVNIGVLKDKVLKSVVRRGDESLRFETEQGDKYLMYYQPDCCASCSIEDVCGDLDDLVGHPILLADEVESKENPEGVVKEYQESFTWTFYKLATIKGSVTIRWYGESNGYYSESVTLEKVDEF